jgi:hypothetical protein
MKLLKTIASVLVASSLVAAPIAAQAAQPVDRAATGVRGENLHGGWVIPLLALAAVILGLIVLLDNDDDTLPHSP